MKIDRWSFDDSGYYAYLLVDCDDSTFNELKTLFKLRKFSVLSSGQSFRPAADGRQYAYYLRLGTPHGDGHRRPSKDSVVSALKFSQLLTEQEPDAQFADTSDVLLEVAEIKAQVAAIARTNQEIAETARTVLSESTKQAQTVHEHLATFSTRLREERTQVINSIISALDDRLGDDERILELQRHVAEFQELESEWNHYIDELKGACDQKDKDIESLKQELEANIGKPGDQPQRKVARHSLEAIFRACLPSVNLVRGCEQVLFFEFKDPSRAISKISQLVLDPQSLRGESVEGAKGWFELRFSTGSSNNGRLYFRRGDSQLDALVSTKQEQDADIRYLCKHT